MPACGGWATWTPVGLKWWLIMKWTEAERQVAIGANAETVLDAWCRQWFDVEPVTEATQGAGVDRVFSARTGRRLSKTVEYKFEPASATYGNIFAEMTHTDGRPGYVAKSRADVVMTWVDCDVDGLDGMVQRLSVLKAGQDVPRPPGRLIVLHRELFAACVLFNTPKLPHAKSGHVIQGHQFKTTGLLVDIDDELLTWPCVIVPDAFQWDRTAKPTWWCACEQLMDEMAAIQDLERVTVQAAGRQGEGRAET